MIRVSFIVSMLMAVGALGWAYHIVAGWLVLVIMIGIALIWSVCQWRGWGWFAGIGLSACTLAAGYGVWIGLPAGWMLAGVMGGLLSWDLSEFMIRLRDIDREDRQAIGPPHMARLGILILISLALSSAALFLQVSFTFEWAVFLVLFGAWGVSLLVRWLRKAGD